MASSSLRPFAVYRLFRLQALNQGDTPASGKDRINAPWLCPDPDSNLEEKKEWLRDACSQLESLKGRLITLGATQSSTWSHEEDAYAVSMVCKALREASSAWLVYSDDDALSLILTVAQYGSTQVRLMLLDLISHWVSFPRLMARLCQRGLLRVLCAALAHPHVPELRLAALEVLVEAVPTCHRDIVLALDTPLVAQGPWRASAGGFSACPEIEALDLRLEESLCAAVGVASVRGWNVGSWLLRAVTSLLCEADHPCLQMHAALAVVVCIAAPASGEGGGADGGGYQRRRLASSLVAAGVLGPLWLFTDCKASCSVHGEMLRFSDIAWEALQCFKANGYPRTLKAALQAVQQWMRFGADGKRKLSQVHTPSKPSPLQQQQGAVREGLLLAATVSASTAQRDGEIPSMAVHATNGSTAASLGAGARHGHVDPGNGHVAGDHASTLATWPPESLPVPAIVSQSRIHGVASNPRSGSHSPNCGTGLAEEHVCNISDPDSPFSGDRDSPGNEDENDQQPLLPIPSVRHRVPHTARQGSQDGAGSLEERKYHGQNGVCMERSRRVISREQWMLYGFPLLVIFVTVVYSEAMYELFIK
eukprot:jgi/Mesvir1/28089/Mv04679-RA.2